MAHTKQTKHFSALKRGDNFMLANKHLVFIKRIHGDRVGMEYGGRVIVRSIELWMSLEHED